MSLLEEIFDDSSKQLNERPYTRTQSAIDSAKGKVKGMFGSGQVEQGAAEVGNQANSLWNDFKKYIGRKYGSPQQSVPYSDVAAFFKGNKLDIKFLGNNERRTFSPKDVGTALLSAVRELSDLYQDQEDNKPDNNPQNPPSTNSQDTGTPSPSNNSDTISSVLASLSSEDRAKLLKLIS